MPGNDLIKYMTGAWKRNLVWRYFGGNFDLMSSASTHIVVEPVQLKGGGASQTMQWYFGPSLHADELRYGILVKVQSDDSDQQLLQVWHRSYQGLGHFHAQYAVMVFNLQMDDGVVVTTCRAIDEDTMAVCTVDVNASQAPHVMYGNMFRIKPEVYRALTEEVTAPALEDGGIGGSEPSAGVGAASSRDVDSNWVGGPMEQAGAASGLGMGAGKSLAGPSPSEQEEEEAAGATGDPAAEAGIAARGGASNEGEALVAAADSASREGDINAGGAEKDRTVATEETKEQGATEDDKSTEDD